MPYRNIILFFLSFSACFAQNPENIFTIFSPGFYTKYSLSLRHAARYEKNHIIHKPYTACTYNDARAEANFGQGQDITILEQQYNGCCNENDATRIILAGISRGASTLFNFIGKKRPKNIAAIIAESPFATVDDVIEHKIKNINWIPGIYSISQAVFGLMHPSYNWNGPQPISSIQFPFSAPILIACSKKDAVIPYTSSMRLAHQLREQGCEVYLLIFEDGDHGFLSYKEEFQQVTNALYAHYNLPHNATLANQGMTKLNNCKL